jgi:hypothetical protein
MNTALAAEEKATGAKAPARNTTVIGTAKAMP